MGKHSKKKPWKKELKYASTNALTKELHNRHDAVLLVTLSPTTKDDEGPKASQDDFTTKSSISGVPEARSFLLKFLVEQLAELRDSEGADENSDGSEFE